MICMTLLLIVKHAFAAPSPDAMMLVKSLMAPVVFIGLPIALYASSAVRRA